MNGREKIPYEIDQDIGYAKPRILLVSATRAEEGVKFRAGLLNDCEKDGGQGRS